MVYHQVIVSYDIENTKVRTALRKALMGMGLVPVQKSVMWGYLNHPEEKAVVALLAATERASPTDALFLARAELEAAVGITTFGIQPVLFEHPDDDKIV